MPAWRRPITCRRRSSCAAAGSLRMSTCFMPTTWADPTCPQDRLSRINRSPLAELGDAGEDVVGGFGPGEGLRVGVGFGDVGEDRRLQLVGAGEGAAFEATAAEQREPALDKVEPGRRGRALVHKSGPVASARSGPGV